MSSSVASHADSLECCEDEASNPNNSKLNDVKPSLNIFKSLPSQPTHDNDHPVNENSTLNKHIHERKGDNDLENEKPQDDNSCNACSCKLNDSAQFPKPDGSCYNEVLDDEIRNRLDKLNALGDLINSLERQFDEANNLFGDTLKCSTDRLSIIAKTLGTKSIKYGRVYHAAKISVEQSQSDCQRACVQFEQANNDHQFAKRAIKEAELKLRNIAGDNGLNGVITTPNTNLALESDLKKLHLNDRSQPASPPTIEGVQQQEIRYNDAECDISCTKERLREQTTSSTSITAATLDVSSSSNTQSSSSCEEEDEDNNNVHSNGERVADKSEHVPDLCETAKVSISTDHATTKLSEELNQAIIRLIEAEKRRCLSEKHHQDEANKLMLAQENLLKIERDYGPSIKRSQFYFDEAKRFNARLNSVKRDICRISEEILAAKQSYAQTLSELEQFSEDLHEATVRTL